MRRLVFAELRRSVRRVVAPGVAIVISVAFVTLTLGATAIMKSYLEQVAAVRAHLSDVVLAPSAEDQMLPADLARRAATVPGVAHADPMYGGAVEVNWPDGVDYSEVVSVPAQPRLRWMTVTTGRLPERAGEIGVDADAAAELGVQVGSTLRVGRTGATASPVTVVGIADLGPSGSLAMSRTVLVPESVAPGLVDGRRPREVDVLVTPGADPAQVRDAVRAALGRAYGQDASAVAVRTGPEQAVAAATELTRGVDLIGRVVLGFAAIGAIVSTLVISNTFAALFAQRTRALGLVRCVGATRRQVRRAVLGETAVVGVASAVAGVVTGLVLIRVALAVLRSRVDGFAGVQAPMPWWSIALPLAVGSVSALVAGVLPAIRATRVAPLAALRPIGLAATRRVSTIRTVAGVVVLGIGAVPLVAGASGRYDTVGVLYGMIGGVVTLIGVLLLGPVLVPAAVRALAPLVGRRPTGLVAVGSAVRNPVRAASTAVALLAGVCLVTTVSVGAATLTKASDRLIEDRFPLDLMIWADGGRALPADLVPRLAAVPGVGASVALPAATVTGPDGHALAVVGTDAARLASVWRGGTAPVRPGSVLLHQDVARQYDVRTGGQLRLRPAGADGSAGSAVVLTVEVTGIPATLIDSSDLARLGAPTTGTATTGTATAQVWLKADDGADASALRTAVRRAVQGTSGVQVGGAVTQRAQIEGWVENVTWVVIGLLAVAVLIAVVGIANTMTLSVLERRQELGVQRALGMTRRQVVASLQLEGLMLAVVGAALGVGLGIGYGWAGARAIVAGMAGVGGLPPVVPWQTVGAVAGVACLAAVLAAAGPARRAARLAPTEALTAD